MPQETDFNISPYFDDFDLYKNYHKVLFKPGYPVQARELNTTQSILQNQIEQFGNHVFKEGASVTGGECTYKNDLCAVLVENQYLGVNVEIYSLNLIRRKIRGKSSGVTALVEYFIDSKTSVLNQTTLYVSYLTSGNNPTTNQKFLDGEELEVVDSTTSTAFVNGRETNIILQSGQSFAKTINSNCNRIGSAVFLKSGVWYLRGSFVNVIGQTLFLDQYNNNPSAKVGFKINELIINSYEDNTLNDNSNGFTNYAAPGADRFRIEAILSSVPLSETNTENFIQIKEIRDGVDFTFTSASEYNLLAQEFARRTYDESGDYYVQAPNIASKETLNNLKGNNGVFTENQLTYNNNTPNENLGTYSISPTNAYIRGYNVGNVATTFLDFPKPRTTKTLTNQSINYLTGPTYTLNNVDGCPIIGLSTSYTVSLRNSRKGLDKFEAQGKEIGIARVYDFALESGSYDTLNRKVNQWDITLYDIQTYADITLNEPISLSTPVHIKGKSSGATAHLRYSTTNSGILTAYNIKGRFSIGEKLIFNGIENPRVSVSVNTFGENDVQSLFGVVGSAFTFNADTRLFPATSIGSVDITANSGGISTVTSNDIIFTGIATVGNIVAFTNPGITPISYAKVNSVSETSITISGITTVNGICDGSLPSSTISPANFTILSSKLQSSTDNTLFTVLPKKKVSSVGLTNSYLTIRKQYDVTITSNSVGPLTSLENETFLPFDEERYVLIRQDGYTETLTEDRFVFTNGSRTLTINGLNGNGPAKLIATLRKINVKEKIKLNNKVKTLTVSKSKYEGSGVGATTLNDGLTYGNFPYGTRVQDEEICLLEPDVTKIYAVYESNDTNSPDLPRLTFSDLSGPTNKTGDLILGDEIVGKNSKSVALYAEKINDLNVGIVYLNSTRFINGEVVTFKQSGITATITSVIDGDNNITSNFILDQGQKTTIYDYSKITRKSNFREPNKKIKIVYQSASFSASDNGDLVTVNSYSQFDYCDIGKIGQISNSDILDIRPRVSNFTGSSFSPFEFLSRDFSQVGNNTANILASDESILLDYSFYLPRIDKIFLSKNGVFQLSQGAPAENPAPPAKIDDALELATVSLPAYLCDMQEVAIYLTEHRRYRMSDIKKLEDRISNLEYYTTLSLLEKETENLIITDSKNLNRFKSGFFVDNFTTTLAQRKTTNVKNSIDIQNRQLRPPHFTTQIDLLLGTQSIIGIGTTSNPNADLRYANDLIGTGVKRTGQLLTLDYEQVREINQQFSTFVVSVNPYADTYYGGTIQLYPSSDIWIEQMPTQPKTVDVAGNYTETLLQYDADPQNGFSPIIWDSWETVWTGTETETSTPRVYTSGYNTYSETITTTTTTSNSTRTGEQTIVTPQYDSQSLGSFIISSSVIPFMRSRNVEFTAKRLKPLTQVYSFFDGVDVNTFITPKLIEIKMISGTFKVGETVTAELYLNNPFLPPTVTFTSCGRAYSNSLKFRVAKSNHKYGAYDNPSDVYTTNPYNSNLTIPDAYSSTSTILNVDTYSLSTMAQGSYYGYLRPNMILRGSESGAQASISDIRLVSDNVGTLIGSFFIPSWIDGNRFECGTKLFKLTSSPTNSSIEGINTTGAEERYFAEGTLNTTQENILVVKNARVETITPTESKTDVTTGTPVVNTTLIGTTSPPPTYTPTTTRRRTSTSTSSSSSSPKPVVEISGAIQTGDYGQFSGKTLGGVTFNTDGTVSNGVYIGNGQYQYSAGSSTTWGVIDPATGTWKDNGVPSMQYTNTTTQQVYPRSTSGTSKPPGTHPTYSPGVGYR